MGANRTYFGKGGVFPGRWIAGGVVWLGLIVGAMVAVSEFSAREGAGNVAPGEWPQESRLERTSDLPALVVFLHPHCPCSRATMAELERLLAECGRPLLCTLAFTQPEGAGEGWMEGDLWRKAAEIPGVVRFRDESGREARLFGAETSGQAVLYGADGKLAYQGGLTASRGHEGDNPGRSALLGQLRGSNRGSMRGPVFGCPLLEKDCEK